MSSIAPRMAGQINACLEKNKGVDEADLNSKFKPFCVIHINNRIVVKALIDSGNVTINAMSDVLARIIFGNDLTPHVKPINLFIGSAKRGKGGQLDIIGRLIIPIEIRFTGTSKIFRTRPLVIRNFTSRFNIAGTFMAFNKIDHLYSRECLQIGDETAPLLDRHEPNKILKEMDFNNALQKGDVRTRSRIYREITPRDKRTRFSVEYMKEKIKPCLNHFIQNLEIKKINQNKKYMINVKSTKPSRRSRLSPVLDESRPAGPHPSSKPQVHLEAKAEVPPPAPRARSSHGPNSRDKCPGPESKNASGHVQTTPASWRAATSSAIASVTASPPHKRAASHSEGMSCWLSREEDPPAANDTSPPSLGHRSDPRWLATQESEASRKADPDLKEGGRSPRWGRTDRYGYVAETTHVPAERMKFIKIKIPDIQKGKITEGDGLLEVVPTFMKRHDCHPTIAAMVRTTKDGFAYTSIINSNKEPITIREGEVFGTYHPKAIAPPAAQTSRPLGSGPGMIHPPEKKPETLVEKRDWLIKEFKLNDSPWLVEQPRFKDRAIKLLLDYYDIFSHGDEYGLTDLVEHEIKRPWTSRQSNEKACQLIQSCNRI